MGVILRGAGIVLTSSLTLALNITMTKAPTTFTLSMSTTIAAGVYDLFSFAAKVNSAIRTDIRAKALALGTPPDTVPTAANVLFKFVFPTTWSSTPGANKINCTFDATGFIHGGVQCTLTVFTLNNTSGWASKLGLGREASTTLTGTVVSPLGTVTGTHQPRSIFCFEDSVSDSWDYERRPEEVTLTLRNGKVRRVSQNTCEYWRDFTLIDHPPESTGYPLDALTYSSFSGRSVINFHDPDDSGLTNVSNIHQSRAPVATECIRIAADDFWSRVTSITSTQVLTAETWPTTIEPTAGDSIAIISEAHALWIEAHRTGWLFCFEKDDTTGQPLFKASAYALRLNGDAPFDFTRRDNYTLLYSVTFPLQRRVTPETVQV